MCNTTTRYWTLYSDTIPPIKRGAKSVALDFRHMTVGAACEANRALRLSGSRSRWSWDSFSPEMVKAHNRATD